MRKVVSCILLFLLLTACNSTEVFSHKEIQINPEEYKDSISTFDSSITVDDISNINIIYALNSKDSIIQLVTFLVDDVEHLAFIETDKNGENPKYLFAGHTLYGNDDQNYNHLYFEKFNIGFGKAIGADYVKLESNGAHKAMVHHDVFVYILEEKPTELRFYEGDLLVRTFK